MLETFLIAQSFLFCALIFPVVITLVKDKKLVDEIERTRKNNFYDEKEKQTVMVFKDRRKTIFILLGLLAITFPFMCFDGLLSMLMMIAHFVFLFTFVVQSYELSLVSKSLAELNIYHRYKFIKDQYDLAVEKQQTRPKLRAVK
jgi:UDP-N-acetylmuramyl pentapeptide phosphotransferase/UDP-N-acetylglucosamine-1-phosphate transferase